VARQAEIARLAQQQLFFVGGAPRSGTTWLQLLLDSHPNVSCHGEGLFQHHLADPLATVMAARGQAIAGKNERLFRHSGGFPPPAAEDVEMLLGTAILLALERQRDGKPCRAIGEKTPENVFFFPRLKRLFPGPGSLAWHVTHAMCSPRPGTCSTREPQGRMRLSPRPGSPARPVRSCMRACAQCWHCARTIRRTA
jgi:hypothetical protein